MTTRLALLPLLGLLLGDTGSVAAQAPPTPDQLAAGEAVRGWGNATWGQSEEEVLASYDGKLERLAKPEEYTKKGKDTYQLGTLRLAPFDLLGTPMAVVFVFGVDSKKLERVTIEPLADKTKLKFLRNPTVVSALESIVPSVVFAKLEPLLIEKYGPSTTTSDESGGTKQRTWKLKKTTLSLTYLKFYDVEFCKLSYDDAALRAAELNKI